MWSVLITATVSKMSRIKPNIFAQMVTRQGPWCQKMLGTICIHHLLWNETPYKHYQNTTDNYKNNKNESWQERLKQPRQNTCLEPESDEYTNPYT